MALFAPDPAAVTTERRRILREVVLRGGMRPRTDPDRGYREALNELDRDGFAWLDDRDVLRPHLPGGDDDEHDVIISARWVLVELENARDRSLPMGTLRDRSAAERIPEVTLKVAIRWLRDAELCKLKDGTLRDVTGEKGRKQDRSIRPELTALRRPIPVETPPPAPAPRTVTPSRMDPHDDPFHPSHPDYIAPSPPPRPKSSVTQEVPPAPVRATAPMGKGMDSSGGRGSLSATATAPAPPSVGNGMEILLDVHRRVKRLEDVFSSTEPDKADVSTLIDSAHPDTVNCLRRLCVLLQVYGSSKRHALTDGRISSKHKVRLPEAISLGLRTGTLGLSTSDGKSLTLRDHAVAMSDAELEQRAAEQRERDSKKGKKRA